ncbi:MAG: hypothetical protein MK193_04520 [Lentisphaeria bacterium]|nr:hypothetical protein [Lentisphaeria bacterium]
MTSPTRRLANLKVRFPTLLSRHPLVGGFLVLGLVGIAVLFVHFITGIALVVAGFGIMTLQYFTLGKKIKGALLNPGYVLNPDTGLIAVKANLSKNDIREVNVVRNFKVNKMYLPKNTHKMSRVLCLTYYTDDGDDLQYSDMHAELVYGYNDSPIAIAALNQKISDDEWATLKRSIAEVDETVFSTQILSGLNTNILPKSVQKVKINLHTPLAAVESYEKVVLRQDYDNLLNCKSFSLESRLLLDMSPDDEGFDAAFAEKRLRQEDEFFKNFRTSKLQEVRTGKFEITDQIRLSKDMMVMTRMDKTGQFEEPESKFFVGKYGKHWRVLIPHTNELEEQWKNNYPNGVGK